jgi:hypothetical protein
MNDATCTNAGCHSPLDAGGNPSVPEANLDLTDDPAPVPGNLFTAYRELFANDVERDVNGLPIEFPVFDINGDPVYVIEVDANGDPVLDVNGDPVLATDGMGNFIQETEQRTVFSTMSPTGARVSAGFFDQFFVGNNDVIHEGALTPAEIRLLSEWLDIGAQYYNNPFDAP